MADTKINVSFLKGTQSGFDGLSSYKAGAFYLTTDTNRLYFADSTSKANYLNKYVHTVSNTDALKSAITNKDVVNGDFAYVSGLNALVAIQNGTWVQINSYSNDDTKTTGLTFTKNTVNADDTSITFNYELAQQTTAVDGTKTTLTPITGSFSFTAADIKAIIDIAVNVGATVSSGTATVKTSGTGSAGSGFTVKGKGSVQVGGSANAITITGTDTQYTLTSPANDNNIILTASDNTTNKVAIVEGNQITVDGSVDKQIKIHHGTITTTPSTPDAQYLEFSTYNADGTKIFEDEFDVISNVTVDNGHVTGITTQKFIMPPDRDIKSMSIGAVGTANQGKLSVVLENPKTKDVKTFTSGQEFYVTVGGATKETKYLKQDLDVYTTGEIDSKISAINDTIKGTNAMVYKGTVGGTGATVSSLPTSGVAVGDTYKVNKAGTYVSGVTSNVGDLLIAIAKEGYTEGADGKLPSGGVTWTYIPSGDDYDATFSFKADTTNNKLILEEDADKSVKGSITFATANDAIVVSSTKTDGKNMTLNVDHKAYSDPTKGTATASITHSTSSKSNTFKAITGVTTDKGHLTGFTETTYTLPQDKDSKYDLSASSVATNKVKITLTGSGDAAGDVDNVNLIAGTDLTGSITDTNTITLNHATYGQPATPSATTGTLGTDSSGRKTITAVTGLTTQNGHVTHINTSTFAIPKDSQYTLGGATVASATIGTEKGFKITNTLSGVANSGASGDSSSAAFSLVSSSLALAQGTDSNSKPYVSVNLEWGSF